MHLYCHTMSNNFVTQSLESLMIGKTLLTLTDSILKALNISVTRYGCLFLKFLQLSSLSSSPSEFNVLGWVGI